MLFDARLCEKIQDINNEQFHVAVHFSSEPPEKNVLLEWGLISINKMAMGIVSRENLKNIAQHNYIKNISLLGDSRIL